MPYTLDEMVFGNIMNTVLFYFLLPAPIFSGISVLFEISLYLFHGKLNVILIYKWWNVEIDNQMPPCKDKYTRYLKIINRI